MLPRLIAKVFLFISLTGCVALMDATTDKPLQVDPSKRSFGEYLDDRKLRTVIRVNIRKADPQFDKSHVNVHVYNSVVLLTGEVASKELRVLAGKTAKTVNKVRQVYNELTVGPKSTFISRSGDNWLQSKIKSKLLFNGDIDSDRVEVIVEDDVVYLMGRLTQTQSETVTEVIRTTKGVKKSSARHRVH